MHNTIYEITTYPKKENDFLSQGDFYDHWFMKNVANRLDDNIDRNVYLNLFKDLLKNNNTGKFNLKNNSFAIIEQGKENYFNSKFEQFKESIKKLNKISLYDFSTSGNDIQTEMYTLNNSFSEEYKIYISSDDGDIITFDKFIRDAEIGKNYYIGGILNYYY